jgi:hypothetical protein
MEIKIEWAARADEVQARPMWMPCRIAFTTLLALAPIACRGASNPDEHGFSLAAG